MCLELMPSWCRQLNWENCGIPWVNCAVIRVKDDCKDSSEACIIACQNCAVYSVFPSGMSHSKIAQFNRELIALFRHILYPVSRYKGWIFCGKRWKGLQHSTFKSGRSAFQFSVRSSTTVTDGFHFKLSTRITVELYVNVGQGCFISMLSSWHEITQTTV